ncbi:MAG: DUF2281 domain-containing protein [Gemmatimonadaceae bacterium]|nr:DUF2281 domain-containing protein [Gemmatimonadaceae bacterium]
MNPALKDRILRRLETLSDERAYQVLDYVEFLESKYAERAAPAPNVFQRMMEGVEDTLRAGNVSATAVADAMGFMGKAMGVLNGVAAAGKSVAEDLVSGRSPGAGAAPSSPTPAAPPAPPPNPTP